LSDILDYAEHYVVTILAENKKMDEEWVTENQAVDTKVIRIFNCTVSTMRTAAESLGLTYEKIWDGKRDIYVMGKYQANSARKLYDLVEPEIQTRGNREILLNARSAKYRLPMFKLK
jgi:hypothetical protein